VTAELEQLERGAKISISCLVKYNAKEKKRERERIKGEKN
jgi:hypothetical protein